MKSINYDLNSLVETYNIDNDYEQHKCFEFIEKLSGYFNIKNADILEFGSASGQMTEILSNTAKRVVAVDGSSEFIAIAKQKVKNSNIEFKESYFEDFKTNEKFDCLIFLHIFEHLEKPSLLLSNAKNFLKKDAIVAIVVPNANALSRQLAVKMGLLSSIYELTDNDKHHGHYRVYDWQMLENEIIENGFEIVGRHGLSFKLFSDKQNIEMLKAKIIGEEQIKGLWKLGDEFQNISGAIMIVAKSV